MTAPGRLRVLSCAAPGVGQDLPDARRRARRCGRGQGRGDRRLAGRPTAALPPQP
ncbi:hypothetical protein QJS66_13950 [Kocuria rhizophila]|nr:hypothetical protein QJS66_13950 [Kocuria rhizophila]